MQTDAVSARPLQQKLGSILVIIRVMIRSITFGAQPFSDDAKNKPSRDAPDKFTREDAKYRAHNEAH